MFALLAGTHGGSARDAAHSVQRDLRSLAGMRAVPSLGVVHDLARALGWSTATAAEVIAAERAVHGPDWRAAACAASEADDVAGLSSLVAGGWETREAQEAQEPQTPSDERCERRAHAAHSNGFRCGLRRDALACEDDGGRSAVWNAGASRAAVRPDFTSCRTPSHNAMLEARLAAARGEIGAAAALRALGDRLMRAECLSVDACGQRPLGSLRTRIDDEIAAGVPWSVDGVPLSPDEALHTLDEASAALECANLGGPCMLPHEPRHEAAVRAFWRISTVGLRMFISAAVASDARARRRASQLAARASLALADVEEHGRDGLPALPPELRVLLRSRRARLQLREVAVRVALDGRDSVHFDDADAHEFLSACVRFPKCLSDRDMRALASKAFVLSHGSSWRTIERFTVECHLTRRELAFDCHTAAASAPSCAALAARSEVPC